ncbi:uncharacterized protein LOC134220927 [Armigeres subalbatus]|uniref:uncharacterized protein LOC134220927 n=1 Tax=Armigeres subalbatus TaxID=124917 RepID=UPI002ED258E6
MSAGKYVRAPSVESDGYSEELGEADKVYMDDIVSDNIGATEEVECQEWEKNNMDYRPMAGKPRESEVGWRYSTQPPIAAQTGNASSSGSRLDNAPHFPKNVPTNKLCEEWHRFLGKFEIAASLSNINDPAQLAKHLFMCMGDELQDIVSYANLRPGLNDPRCYQAMIDNINTHLRRLTDPVTEHEAFGRMTQGKDETIINFHARLKSKVRLCEYSQQDEDRFVYTQLLKGMRERKLAEDARIYGHGIDLIVKAAARKEAFTLEIPNNTECEPQVLAVTRKSIRGIQPNRKRSGDSEYPGQRKMQRYVGNRNQGRRFRCWRCNSATHTQDICSARNKKCFNCGIIGHIATTCRRKTIRNIHAKEEKDNAPSGWMDDENQNQV